MSTAENAGNAKNPGNPGNPGNAENYADPDAKLEIQMLHDRVLVRQPQEGGERRSSSGIVIPATAQVGQRLNWGDVLGVGNNVRNITVGNRVLFNPEDTLEVDIQGDAHLVMRERDIHAIASERTEHGTGLYL